jgi:hypothetical protein
MTTETVSSETPPLTLPATIGQLSTWAKGGRMYPIEVAISAVHWMGQTKLPDGYADRASFRETLAELEAWLKNEDPDIPTPIAEDALFWLRQIRERENSSKSRSRK